MARRPSSAPRAALLGLLLALCAADPAREAARREAMLARFESRIREALAKAHWTPASVDLDGLLAEIDRRLAAGEPPEQVDAWMRAHIVGRWLSFAPVNPTLEKSSLYHLPFDARVRWIVSQGVAAQASHQGSNEFAIDFAMPEGTRVLAARRGTVARVVDGFTECCLPAERQSEANEVIVLHPDGTWAMYAHLRPGIPVREGQAVAAGDLLGFSGRTGWAAIPHLHFQVSIRGSTDEMRSLPVRFRDGTPSGHLPAAWRLYQDVVAPQVALRVSADGREAVSGQPFEIGTRAPIQLRVERVGAPGEALDVTRDAGTSYVALTPWSLAIDRGGRVVFDPPSEPWQKLPEPIRRGVAIATILFHGDDGREGRFDVWFRFAGAAGAAPEKR